MAIDTEPRDTQKETANDIVSTSATEVPSNEPLPSPLPSLLSSPLPNSSAEVLLNNVPFDFDSYISDLFPGTELLWNNLPDTDPLSNVEPFVFRNTSKLCQLLRCLSTLWTHSSGFQPLLAQSMAHLRS